MTNIWLIAILIQELLASFHSANHMANKAVRIIIIVPLSLVVSCVASVTAIYGEAKLFDSLYLFTVWFWPGTQLTRLIMRSVAHEILYGSQDSRFYWPEATIAGLRLWLSVASWWAVSFVIMYWVAATRTRKQ